MFLFDSSPFLFSAAADTFCLRLDERVQRRPANAVAPIVPNLARDALDAGNVFRGANDDAPVAFGIRAQRSVLGNAHALAQTIADLDPVAERLLDERAFVTAAFTGAALAAQLLDFAQKLVVNVVRQLCRKLELLQRGHLPFVKKNDPVQHRVNADALQGVLG